MARLTCGSCKETVTSVEHVKQCYAAKNVDPFASIPVGNDGTACYALRAPEDGRIMFFEVVRHEGEKTDLLKQVGPYLRRPPKHSVQKYLERIVADPLAAALLYGEQTGRCSRCKRRLTNPDSLGRKYGPYGPVCYKIAFGDAA